MVKLKTRQWRKHDTKPTLKKCMVAIFVCVAGVKIWKNKTQSTDVYTHVTNMGASSSISLRTKIDHNVMRALRKHMKQQQASMPQQWNGDAALHMIHFLRTQAPTMFPLLGDVPITANAVKYEKDFHGQELEDKEIYQRFLNEYTRTCHTFGIGGVFESGAYQGVEWSNTYFFEKHFAMPSVLVEASENNWKKLDDAVATHRPLAEVHHAALCPVGDEVVCLDEESTKLHNAMNKVQENAACKNPIPCYNFDDRRHYALVSLDIEGFEWEFLKLRNLQADLIVMEVAQWVRYSNKIMTVVEVVARMADLGYYLYAPTDHMIGGRNFLFVSKDLVQDCFSKNVP
mmetsp:Transcript_60505/g.70772  ORF Transcript_60505/g.70772 Transcript_60505/m.70772 type:complete len:343 (+) Transcript_60505:203-1231(+)|eukprot:CAMPEP_0194380294 /NCGR_PEP_ID=MMETSP0174-20130528/44154_1 /TAXON_ID=216777 /ORGANISM="Proboscia alata, Strain PI-D3" /LENGTH=342 /DNA_ID=CAMNT_0039163611 /DNA_START=216 /DNA_END=1244 /DNA_ORIENTATION=-